MPKQLETLLVAVFDNNQVQSFRIYAEEYTTIVIKCTKINDVEQPCSPSLYVRS